MSGIVGMFERGGAPVDRSLLEALTSLLIARGPDSRGISVAGPVGLGHTLLRTVRESSGEHQPASLDGRLWITADARLDRRAELIAEIERLAPTLPPAVSDGELILHSYAMWGNDCLQHLRGDFAFAIWDLPRRALFCARDHFGVKPFYYAELGNLFLFSNTLDCALAHPAVSDELNDHAIGDFLLRGFNSDLETTSFRDVRRLPPAHFLVASEDGVRTQRYWSLPLDGRIRYRQPAEYVEHFRSLLQDAVSDRLRCDRVGVWMSGGMDSSTVAATARKLSGSSSRLSAYTMVYESLIPDVEKPHAQEVADFLGIPIHYLKMDDIVPFGSLQNPAVATSEPVEDPFFAGVRRHYETVAGECRVMLSGEGADALMHFRMWPYARDLFRRKEWGRLFAEVPAYLQGRSFPWKGIHQRLRQFVGTSAGRTEMPDWVSPELAAKLGRNGRPGGDLRPSAPHPFSPMAQAFLSAPQWAALLELCDPGLTHSPVEVRHPFLDLRIVEYFMAIPPFPWSLNKRLLRDAMVGELPAATLCRRKTPLAEDPISVTFGRLGTSYFERLPWDGDSGRYLGHPALLRRLKLGDLTDGVIRSVCLNFWLRSGRRIRYKLSAEVRNG
jgi:asparagine synthase (glutamine-hydrolysing)